MACHCDNCSHSKRISTFRQLQPDDNRSRHCSKYPKKSTKIFMDRYLSARKNLLQHINWYYKAHKRGAKRDIFHEPLTRSHWYARKYRETRAVAKELGLI